jgi:hypothetical protein
MMRSLAGKSLLLFVICFVIVVAHTLLESTIGAWSFGVQRLIIFLGIVLPAGVGAVLGVLSLVRKEGRTWLAVLGIVLNTLFALFHILIILIAG